MTKTIYLAGGCFWGMQKYLKLIHGVYYAEDGDIPVIETVLTK